MEPDSQSFQQDGVFSVEIYLRLVCAACRQTLKRRLVDYLTTRASHCPHCQAKMVHLARGQTTQKTSLDLDQLKSFIEELESQWTGLVNESIMMQSSPMDIDPGSPQ